MVGIFRNNWIVPINWSWFIVRYQKIPVFSPGLTFVQKALLVKVVWLIFGRDFLSENEEFFIWKCCAKRNNEVQGRGIECPSKYYLCVLKKFKHSIRNPICNTTKTMIVCSNFKIILFHTSNFLVCFRNNCWAIMYILACCAVYPKD